MLAMMVSSVNFAQNVKKGKVVDVDNKPLFGADVVTQNNKGTSTDMNGEFQLEVANNEEVTVSYVGYVTQKVTLKSGMNIIALLVDENALEEVVISASREKQLRNAVPAAISVINAQEIDEQKAFGIEQLVNNVSGVFMSTSKAASNEQHFMSVRSPISTKSLFLYVEDGLPIRPTSVFNHNALLEMNSTAFERVEVIKGPASSIYGSESIGGSFNFLTKTPKPGTHGMVDFQMNSMGLKKYEFEVSNHNAKDFGFYIGTHYVDRKEGPIDHSNYEKFALTFKTDFDLSESLKWTNAMTVVDYRSDMSGSLSERNYLEGKYESNQTFSEREALSFRFRSTLDKRWNDAHKTSFNFVYRDNKMDQIPSYRIRQFRNQGQLTGAGSGEINSNQFNSFVGLIQHKMKFNDDKSSLVLGASVDFSPQDYVAERISVVVDTDSRKNVDYVYNPGDYILNYNADILNYAGYFQYEISPVDNLNITAALRYDKFIYDYDNLIDSQAGARDSKTDYESIAPKLGLNYNFDKVGLYANYSKGFTPPQTSSLYRNSLVGVGGEVFNLKPSHYNNYEIGAFYSDGKKWKLDAAIYMLDGKNTLITLRNENDEFYNANAGKTRSVGIEYGIEFSPIDELTIAHNGSYAKHRYLNFFSSGVDYSDTDMETAPSLLGMTTIKYKPSFLKNFMIAAEHELVGKYNTSFENQVDNGDGTFSTSTYDGHNVFNIRASYEYKNFEIWAHGLNIFDQLYAVRASYNRYRKSNSYSIGNPSAIHAGIKYKF